MTHISTEKPEALALADLRHLYQQMAGGQVKDAAQAKRIAQGILSRAIQKLEAAQASAQEPFGYFKAEPFGWTDCGPDDEGAMALHEHPQTQRAPLTDAQIKEGRNTVNDDPDDRPEPWAFREGVKFAERMHGITQEKQG